MGSWGCFPQGKPAVTESCYPTVINSEPSVRSIFCVTIPSAVRRTLLRHMDKGSLTCAQIWSRAVITKVVGVGWGGGSGTNKSAQELTRRDRKSVCHPAPLGDGARVWG